MGTTQEQKVLGRESPWTPEVAPSCCNEPGARDVRMGGWEIKLGRAMSSVPRRCLHHSAPQNAYLLSRGPSRLRLFTFAMSPGLA